VIYTTRKNWQKKSKRLIEEEAPVFRRLRRKFGKVRPQKFVQMDLFEIVAAERQR
jgi:hypothetical protein